MGTFKFQDNKFPNHVNIFKLFWLFEQKIKLKKNENEFVINDFEKEMKTRIFKFKNFDILVEGIFSFIIQQLQKLIIDMI